ncbi:lachesin-like [Bacillus rossius redtenbacheri]|uniref:lachesin-like n=1 Tax=Bacillus rossius redtenbacheri TaxID=93214 RepID=UPI002FDDD817
MEAARRQLLLLSALLALAAGQVPAAEVVPEFLAPLENITVSQGRDIYFTCVVNHLGQYTVAWIKSDTKAILAIHTRLVAHNPRLSVTHNGHNTWKLHVSNVQKGDSGTYMCQINTDPMRSQMGLLDVVVPPDILNDEETADGGVAPENGSVRLRCKATGVPEPRVQWKREDHRSIVLRHDGGRERQAVMQYEGETLLLSSIQRSDMGVYLCIASNGVPPTVSKRYNVQVHFHPVIRVSNQLVAAPVGSDVLVQCYVEASPKAMNSWYKETGEKLEDGPKYSIDEVPLNEYALYMNLTIRRLERRDFGGYACGSVNALGKVEGSVRLQELHLAPKTTILPSPAKPDKFHKKHKYGHKHRGRKRPERPADDLSDGDAASGELEGSAETATPGAWPEARTLQTIIQAASKPPAWVLHRNGEDSARSSSVAGRHSLPAAWAAAAVLAAAVA